MTGCKPAGFDFFKIRHLPFADILFHGTPGVEMAPRRRIQGRGDLPPDGVKPHVPVFKPGDLLEKGSSYCFKVGHGGIVV